jgi:hypothetical protein
MSTDGLMVERCCPLQPEHSSFRLLQYPTTQIATFCRDTGISQTMALWVAHPSTRNSYMRPYHSATHYLTWTWFVFDRLLTDDNREYDPFSWRCESLALSDRWISVLEDRRRDVHIRSKTALLAPFLAPSHDALTNELVSSVWLSKSGPC